VISRLYAAAGSAFRTQLLMQKLGRIMIKTALANRVLDRRDGKLVCRLCGEMLPDMHRGREHVRAKHSGLLHVLALHVIDLYNLLRDGEHGAGVGSG